MLITVLAGCLQQASGASQVSEEEWIYFPFWDKLYQMKTDGSEIIQLMNSDDSFDYIGRVSVQEEWIYYTGIRHIGEEERSVTTLYRMKTNGAQKEDIYETEMTSGNSAISGEWIYYCDDVDGTYEFFLTKIRIDGAEKTILTECDDVTGDSNIIVAGDWIYYAAYAADYEQSIYRCSTDGKVNERLSYGGNIYGLNLLSLYKDHIYFGTTNPDRMVKISITGGAIQVVVDGPIDRSAEVFIVDDWVYFISGWEDGKRIYKVRTDGTEKTKLSDDKSRILSLNNGTIFYTILDENDEDAYLYKIGIDGKDRQMICELKDLH